MGALRNSLNGVHINAAPNNTIGGTSTAVRNLISGNNNGVVIDSSSSGNVVQGNYIGTNPAGTAVIPNISCGVVIRASPNNIIGGTVPGARNIISGNNQLGIWITNPAASGNLVQGNYIGTDVNGVADLGNSFSGVQIQNSPNNIIGGTTGGARNVISGNTVAGVFILEPGAIGNQIQGITLGPMRAERSLVMIWAASR